MSNANKSVQGSHTDIQTEREMRGGGGGVRGREDCGQKNWDSDSERLVTESHKMISVFIKPVYKTKVKSFLFLHVSVRMCGSW